MRAEIATKEHRAGEAIISHLINCGGSDKAPNTEIAAALGMDMPTFHRGRRHLIDCPSLGRFTVSHRKANGSLVLIDPDASEGGLTALSIRLRAVRQATERNQAQAASSLKHMLAVWDRAAAEAAARGENDLHRQLDQAVKDIKGSGVIHPSTLSMLDMLGVTV
jgi:hypothetical protein